MLNFIKLPPRNVGKGFDVLTAKLNNLLYGAVKEKIFYLHVHKCGGVSIEQAIKACYNTLDLAKQRQVYHLLDSKASFNSIQKLVRQSDCPFDRSLLENTDDYLELKFREGLLMYYMSQENIDYIGGHFSFSNTVYQHFANQYSFVTVLRDPVERWISLYFWRRFNKQGHRNIDRDIITHLESELGKHQGSGYVKFLGGINQEGDYTSEQAIARATKNLHKFSIVGCLEYQEDFVQQFEERFGRKLKIKRLNRSPKSKDERKSLVTEDIKNEIRKICQPDIAVYRYAVENFVKAK